MTGEIHFFLNGCSVRIDDPPPQLLLLDYLRSPGVALTGAKKGCGQGGCGACTVILSRWHSDVERVEHRAINSCLRPVCALGGLAVTTIEGTGRVQQPPPAHLSHAMVFSRAGVPPGYQAPQVVEARATVSALRTLRASAPRGGDTGILKASALRALDGGGDASPAMNPVAYRLAANNGTQCGYCTPGFVMNMSAFLADNPDRTKRQIEDLFDGNLCRCTGYRPILTGMETFASDWTVEDEKHRMKCLLEDGAQTQNPPGFVSVPFPDGARHGPQPVAADRGGVEWLTPTTMEELLALLSAPAPGAVRLVHGNTSFGIYPAEFLAAARLVDISLIADLEGIDAGATTIDCGAGISYAQLIEALAEASPPATSRLGALQLMARRTAGSIVRNAASLGGNTMLTLHHIQEGEPFPSDLLTALAAVGAELTWINAVAGEARRSTVDELIAAVRESGGFGARLVLVRYHLPIGTEADVVLAQKVALREVNAHSIVNATTRLTFGEGVLVDEAAVVFGGIAPFPWHAVETESALRARLLSLNDFPSLARKLANEVQRELERWKPRLRGLPSEGFTDAFRIELAVSFLYKAVVNALMQRDPDLVPPPVRSSGVATWGHWPVSTGRQHYAQRCYQSPVGQPYIKLLAFSQASGQVHYTHELPLAPTGVNLAFVQSQRALATFHFEIPGSDAPVDREALRRFLAERYSSFVDLLTSDSLPAGGINLQGMGADQPLFAIDQVSYVGQVLALVAADTEEDAIAIADYVTTNCVGYGPVAWPPPWNEPVLSIDRAIEMGSIYPDYPEQAPYVSHIWRVTRPGSRFDWTRASQAPLVDAIACRTATVDGAACQVVEGTQRSGGQVHFYMETQACVVEPADGGCLVVHPSSQSPMEMHQTTAMAVASEYNKIDVQIAPVGGAYGGKTEQARFVTGPAAVAAQVLRRPVRLVMPRDADTAMIGKRHPYYGQFEIAVDTGATRAEDRGRIRGLQVTMWGDGGAFYDCSFIVSNCIQLRADNAYNIANFQSQVDVCRTNTAPNTAFRAFGDIQCKVIGETAIDDAAVVLGMAPEDLRRKNMYVRGDVTPYGQALSYCYMTDVWDFLLTTSAYVLKKAEVAAFNAANKWRKRGVYAVPVKYGSGYNFVQIEQAAAVVSVYAGDGSIVIHQGGVEMGQGLTTKVVQVAAYVLNVPMELIHTDTTRTSVIPNPSSTGASTGTSYNAEATRQACQKLRARLTEFGYQLLQDNGDEWCHQQGVDFWNYGVKGWAAAAGPTGDGGVPPKLVWQNLVQLAYQQRVDLVSAFTAPITGGETPVPALHYKPLDQQPHIPGIEVAASPIQGGAVDSFLGYTFSAACSVVEVDVLTGEVQIISSDIVYDTGWSLNPAIDVGQVEGAFVQGIGYLLSEWLVTEPEGEQRGRLNTTNTWTYKPPAVSSIPLEMNVHLFPRELAASVPENPNDLFSSKEVGEPPLVLSASVFFALKDAIRASRVERGLDPLFRLDAPATVQEVRRACEVSIDHLAPTPG
jgi:xanthine dehydrogenase/oxidase